MADTYIYWWFCYNEMYALVQGPRGDSEAASAGQVAGDIYLTEIHPDRVMEIREDEDGRLVYLKYDADLPPEDADDPIAEHGEPGRRVTIVTAEGAWWYDLRGGTGDHGDVPVAGVVAWPDSFAREGVVPIARLIRDNTPYAPIYFLAQAMLRLFNVLSMVGELEDHNCVPLLVWPVKSPDEIKKLKIGSANALPFPSDGSMPAYLQYDGAPLELLHARVEALVVEIKRLSALVMDQSTGQSGLAKAYAFLQTDRTITSYVAPVERFELEIARSAALWKGADLDEGARPGYPRSYDIQEVNEAIRAGNELLDAEVGPVMRRLTKALMFHKVHQGLSAEERKLVEEELLAMQREEQAGVDQQLPKPAPAEESGPGLPPPVTPDIEAR
jgi:hypothetical protein